MQLQDFVIELVFSYAGTFAFGLFINVPNRYLNSVSCIGSFGWAVYWVITHLGYGSVLGNFTAALLVGFLGMVLSRIKQTPSTMYNAALVPLVPGASGYQALSAFIRHDTLTALSESVNVLMAAGAIAVGYVISQVIAEIIREKTNRGEYD